MLDGGDWVWPAGEQPGPGGPWRRAVRRRPAAAPRGPAAAPVIELEEDDPFEQEGEMSDS